jgi:hypothetical protein
MGDFDFDVAASLCDNGVGIVGEHVTPMTNVQAQRRQPPRVMNVPHLDMNCIDAYMHQRRNSDPSCWVYPLGAVPVYIGDEYSRGIPTAAYTSHLCNACGVNSWDTLLGCVTAKLRCGHRICHECLDRGVGEACTRYK